MQPGYPAARVVAPTVAEHLAAHLHAARQRGSQQFAPQPDTDVIEALIDAAFWASLQREEGRAPKISLAYLPPEAAGHAMVFARPLSLNARDLSKLAPAVERAWEASNSAQSLSSSLNACCDSFVSPTVIATPVNERGSASPSASQPAMPLMLNATAMLRVHREG